MTDNRMRRATLAGSLALSLSLAATPAVMAQDGPTAPVEGVIAAVNEGRLTDAAGYFCGELQASALGGIAQLGEMGDMGLGVDMGMLLDLIDITVTDVALEVSDETPGSATVGLSANVATSISEDGVVAFAVAMMSTEEAPIDESMAEALVPMLLPELEAQFATSISFDESVNVVVEDGQWKVCSDLASLVASFGGAVGPSGDEGMPDASPEASPDGDGTADATSEGSEGE